MYLSYDDAQRVVRDKTNPLYVRYHNNDPDVHRAVTAANLRQITAKFDLADTTPEVLRGAQAGSNDDALRMQFLLWSAGR